MNEDLKALEEKLAQLIALYQSTRQENLSLRQELAQAQSDTRQLRDQMAQASVRLAKLIDQLPQELEIKGAE